MFNEEKRSDAGSEAMTRCYVRLGVVCALALVLTKPRIVIMFIIIMVFTIILMRLLTCGRVEVESDLLLY